LTKPNCEQPGAEQGYLKDVCAWYSSYT